MTKVRKDAKGDAAQEATLLEGFQQLMGWSSPATMLTYTKTMNKREAIQVVLDDEEAVAQQEQGAVTTQTMIPRAERHPPCTEHACSSGSSAGESALSDDHDELSWYEE